MNKTRKAKKEKTAAVAVFHGAVEGDVVILNCRQGVRIKATFTKLPKVKHGFHIHKAGDLRGEGCKGACEHYDVGKHTHGSYTSKQRHTGDLGNIEMKHKKCTQTYTVRNTSVRDLWGRSIIVHADEDDLGKGGFLDSTVIGHSGARIAFEIIRRGLC